MSNRQIINLNRKVRVKLTPFGKRVFKCHFQSKKSPVFYTDQLWSLMEIFGGELHIGFNIPFENNEIEILNED